MIQTRSQDAVLREVSMRPLVAIAVMFVLALIANAARNSFQFFAPGLEEDLRTSRAGVSLAMSVFIVAAGATGPLAGRLVDRHGPRKVIAGGISLMGLSLLLASGAPSAATFVAAFGGLGGIAFGSIIGAPSQLFVFSWFTKHRTLTLAVLSNAYSAGLLFLAPVWAALADGVGWRVSYASLGITVILLALPLAVIGLGLPSTAGQRHPAGNAASRSLRDAVASSLRERNSTVVLGGLFVCGTTMGIVDVHLVPLFHEDGLHHGEVAGTMSLLGGMIIVGGLITGWLADRLSDRRLVLSVLFAVRFAALGVLAAPLGPWKAVVFALLFGLSYSGVIPVAAAALADVSRPGTTGSLLGLGVLIHQVGGVVGSSGVGLLHNVLGTYQGPVLVAGLLALTASFVAWTSCERRDQWCQREGAR